MDRAFDTDSSPPHRDFRLQCRKEQLIREANAGLAVERTLGGRTVPTRQGVQHARRVGTESLALAAALRRALVVIALLTALAALVLLATRGAALPGLTA